MKQQAIITVKDLYTIDCGRIGAFQIDSGGLQCLYCTFGSSSHVEALFAATRQQG